MQLVVLPGMDGGAELSRQCRTLLSSDFAVDAVEYPNESLSIARVPAEVMTSRVRTVLATDSRPALSTLSVPLLAIRATQDRLVDPRSAPEAHGAMATTEIDGPHLALHCRPEACSAVIREWLQSGAPV